jgi:hypothetical protein
MTAQARQGVPPGTQQLLADLCLESLSGPDACRWALSALEAGFDTPSLRILAGMSFGPEPGFFEVRPYLDAALSELNLRLNPSRDEVLREYARVLAEELLAGVRPVEATLEVIHRTVVSPLNHAEDLKGWCYLWEGLAPDGSFGAVSGSELERATREFAARWLAGQDSVGSLPSCDA